MKVIKLGYSETAFLARALTETLGNDLNARATLCVAIEDNEVKFKINEDMWTPPMGTRDPRYGS